MQHYQELDQFERDGFTVIVDKTDEDMDPWDQLSECFDDKAQLYADIQNYKYDWFMLRIRVMMDGYEMGSHYLGGCLYEDAREVLKDGTMEDCLGEALAEAKREVKRMQEKLSSYVLG